MFAIHIKAQKFWKRYSLEIFFFVFILIIGITIGMTIGKAFGVEKPKPKPKAVSIIQDRPEFKVKPAITTTTTTTTTVPQVERKSIQAEPVAVTPSVPLPPGSHQDWMAQAGIAESDYGYVDYIISHESGWLPSNVNGYGCIGLGQNCPSNGIYFLKVACPDWESNPICQLQRWTVYASKYGGWAGSYQHWLSAKSW